MKRRTFAAAVLCLIMILTLATPAAQAVQVENAELATVQAYFEEDVSRATLQQAVNGYGLLEDGNLPLDALSSIQKSLDGTLVYRFDYGTIFNDIIPVRQTNGTLYKITEGEKYNELFVATNGNLYVNNHLITIEFDTPTDFYSGISKSPFINFSEYQTMANGGYWTEECPYGVPSEYNYLVDTLEISNLALGEAILNYTLTTFIRVVAYAFIPGATAVPSYVFTAIFGDMLEFAPYTEAVSGYTHVFYHESTEEFWIINSPEYRLGAEKHLGTIFTERNYEGYASTVFLFSCTEYNY